MSTNISESAFLIARYVSAAESYGDAVEADDPERAHAAQAALQAALHELAACDQTRAVLPLLEDDRLAVC